MGDSVLENECRAGGEEAEPWPGASNYSSQREVGRAPGGRSALQPGGDSDSGSRPVLTCSIHQLLESSQQPQEAEAVIVPDKKTQAQGGKGTCPGSRSWRV